MTAGSSPKSPSETLNLALRRLTYRSEMKALARALGLSDVLRNWYYRLFLPADGVVNIGIGNVSAGFRVSTVGELRNLDPAGGAQREEHLLHLLVSTARSGDVFYDIGANVGLYSILVAKAVGAAGQVIACEPNEGSYQHLRDNLKLNGISNVRAFQKALGEQVGKGKLYRGEGNADSSLAAPPTGRNLGHQIVEVLPGDYLRETEHLPPPRLVKIDVEGYEYSVIRGLSRTLAHPTCELVCCEIHPNLLPKGINVETMRSLVDSLGFGSTELYPRYDTFHLVARKEGDAHL